MSNYIYNDGFNGDGGDREPIRFSFDEDKDKGGVSKKAIALICVACLLASALFGVLGGVFVGRLVIGEKAPSSVYTNTIIQSPVTSLTNSSSNGNPSRADIIEDIRHSVVEIQTQYKISKYQYVQSGAGSGVIVGYCHEGKYNPETDGVKNPDAYYIITNAHVVEGSSSVEYATQIKVILTDSTEYSAEVCGYDTIGDIAVLKIKESERLLKVATFANEKNQLRVGDEVIAIGNPLGELGGTVTNGYISALDRKIEIDGHEMNLIQTDAAINPGNSGGGLFNLNGELIGIVNAKSSGTGIEGLGFAIPVKDALKIYTDLTNLGYVTGRPTIMAEYNMAYGNVIYISDVYESEDGEDNSDVLREFDQIYGVVIDGERYLIGSISALDNLINSSEIGDEITLIIRRGLSSKEEIVTVKVFERKQ
ncbi:MAG: trypsin-like peptidase domain-containing protein [Clostridia bacterium]|nr:trypsin-like peptidase domain-containing protein [Clostridia bacterium]